MPLKQTIKERMIPIENYATIVQNKISVLPVYDGDKAVGLIRDTDIFLAITDNLEA